MPDEAAEANNVQLLWLECSRQNALKSDIKAGSLLSSGTQRAESEKQLDEIKHMQRDLFFGFKGVTKEFTLAALP